MSRFSDLSCMPTVAHVSTSKEAVLPWLQQDLHQEEAPPQTRMLTKSLTESSKMRASDVALTSATRIDSSGRKL